MVVVLSESSSYKNTRSSYHYALKCNHTHNSIRIPDSLLIITTIRIITIIITIIIISSLYRNIINLLIEFYLWMYI